MNILNLETCSSWIVLPRKQIVLHLLRQAPRYTCEKKMENV